MTEAHSTALSGAAAGKSLLFSGKRLPFLATKLVPPRSLGMIDRPRLLGIAGQLPAKRLAVIKAPSGFGKTSLAASWLQWLRKGGNSVAWLAIDPEDDDPPRFLFYVMQAMQRVAGGVGADST